MSEPDYARLTALVASMGYDTAMLRKVPQSWPAPADAGGGTP
jgi:hypothetical protein